MKPTKRLVIESLVIPFSNPPYEGLDIQTQESFQNLFKEGEDSIGQQEEFNDYFRDPIHIKATVIPVASKVDVQGHFLTKIYGICNRCINSVTQNLEGNFSTFLMPEAQFSDHDKPGGKVIHGPTRNQKPSRHHSRSKAAELSHAEGEHEDAHFGAWDGRTIDLRSLIREQLILLIPMSMLCSDKCQGLCIVCGENINEGKCRCSQGPTKVFQKDKEGFSKPFSSFKKRV